MKTKLGKELKIGDVVKTEEGDRPVAITQITNGIYRSSRIIHWRGGDGHAFNNTAYEVARSEPLPLGGGLR